MLRNRSIFDQAVPILGAVLLLMGNGKAIAEHERSSIAEPSIKNAKLNRQGPNNLNLKNRHQNVIRDLAQINQSQIINHNYLSQANNIEELKDIQPTDWSYQALQNLIKRYGCISGFNDRTYRGEQAITRAEFSAALNSCLNSIEKTIAQTKNVPQADLDTVLRLMQEFQSELAILQGRTDGSQARLQDLEATQFSTTSKLQGEAIFGLGSVLSEDSQSTRTILGNRLRLDFQTSFQGDDLLFTRFAQNNFEGFAPELNTFQGNLAFAESNSSSNESSLRLEDLHYSFGVSDRLGLIVGAAGVDGNDIAPTINYLDGDGSSGAVSRFGTRNSLYYAPGEAGLGVNYRPVDQVQIDAGYVASAANESNSGGGLFDGPYSALGQITLEASKNLSLAAIYVHSYNQSDTQTGTSQSNLRAQTASLFGAAVPTVSNSYGLEVSWAISDRIILGGWGGLSKVSNLSTLNQQLDRGTQDIWNWAATLAIPDLGKEGNLAGLVAGSEPHVTNSTIKNLTADSDRPLHLEAFYQYQISNDLAITPGVIWIIKPDGSIQDNDNLVIGTVRTTFSF